MADRADIEAGVQSALVEALPDLTPLFRAAWVFELQEVEKRVLALQRAGAIASGDQESEKYQRQLGPLWARRNELLSVLWPSLDPPAEPGPKAPEAD